ncbi:MAG TPA: transglycosylase SLT domain-containing protein [Candidatus Limnocylindrales bacterium]|nr:transglycosylase SLT domain-containing protein [Candidatus Limnocylindrales bacterium]
MQSRVRVAAVAWSAGVAGLALALSVVALAAGHVTPPAPAVTQFRPVVVPPAPAGAVAAATGTHVSRPILEADLSPRPHRRAPAAPRIRAAAHSVAKYHASSVGAARAYARSRLGATQFGCLDRLWTKESNWNPRAVNRSSGAYGIPQALPGSKMATAGGDWRFNPMTQVRWGLDYIRRAYGTACEAWSHSIHTDWY